MYKLNVVNTEELKKMTYEEICEYSKLVEINPKATEYDLVAIASVKLDKELELGIETGTPAEIVFSRLLNNGKVNDHNRRRSRDRLRAN